MASNSVLKCWHFFLLIHDKIVNFHLSVFLIFFCVSGRFCGIMLNYASILFSSIWCKFIPRPYVHTYNHQGFGLGFILLVFFTILSGIIIISEKEPVILCCFRTSGVLPRFESLFCCGVFTAHHVPTFYIMVCCIDFLFWFTVFIVSLCWYSYILSNCVMSRQQQNMLQLMMGLLKICPPTLLIYCHILNIICWSKAFLCP